MKRFYQAVSVSENNGSFQVTLDGRPVKTALGIAQSVPTRKLADALANEWSQQPEQIDMALFKLRDLAEFAIDMVTPDRAGTITKLLSFLETDTLCYRAEPDEPFFLRQEQIWEPILTALEAREGVTVERICGIMHRPQPSATLDTLRSRLEQLGDFEMTALLTLSSLAASLTIGLASLETGADQVSLWSAANLEEDWQIEQWGEDHEAAIVKARRKADFLNASEFLVLSRR